MSNLLKDDKKLMKEYNYEKNNDINLDNITNGSNKKIWWKCEKGHEWQASTVNRKNGTNCPYCSNRKILIGFNDLASTKPEVLKKWNYKKNEMKPNQIIAGTAKKVWWKCEKGHEWQEEVRRIVQGQGCPICSGHRVLKGYNDLTTTNPELIKEWDYEKNNDKRPEDYSKGSSTKIWWKCEYGHSWEAAIYHRTKDRNCPICNNTKQTSFPEQAIYYYLSKKYNNIINRYKDIFTNSMEIDIYIPNKKVGIEYDGLYFHKGKKSEAREIKKYNICQKNNIKLIRVKEEINNVVNNSSDYTVFCNWSSGKYEDLDKALLELFNYIGVIISVDTKKDKYDIMSLYKSNLKKKSLAEQNPELAKEWNYEKNKDLTPEMFTLYSGISVWWRCPKGHEYKSTINKRNQNQNCPYCSNHKVIKGYNDLASKYPELLKEWNYEKNLNIDPTKIPYGSSKKAWWKCEKGHEWQVSVSKRIAGHSCPYCSNKMVKKDYNDLFTIVPQLKLEWNYEKNIGINPEKLTSGSPKKVWWKCSKGHEYQMSVNRKVKYNNCPICLNRKILPGFNDLYTLYPSLMKEWNYSRNIIKPNTLSPTSGIKVWWKCEKGHEWESSPNNRMKHNCPYCSNQKILEGYNDLATINPSLAKEWNYEKNNNLLPTQVSSKSGKIVWWKCSKCGYEWKATPHSISHNMKCPNCRTKII